MRLSLSLLAVVACACRDTPAPAARYDGGPPPRRVIGAPPRHVRALPPHAIGAEGVGPYKLGVPMAQILSSLPSGPRMALLQIPGVLDYTVVRDEGLLVGGERQGMSGFIGVVRQDIARTAEDGVGVGATAAALTKALGPAQVEPGVARDPALWIGAKLPGARFVMNSGRVAAVLLTATAPTAPVGAQMATAPVPPPEVDAGVAVAPKCERAAVAADDFAGVAAGVGFAPACLGGADGIGVSGDVVVVAGRAAKGGAAARRIAAAEVRGLVWAAPIEVDRGRDEIIAVAETHGEDGRVVTVVALRLEGTRLVRVAEDAAYRLDDTRAAWIGASLSDLTLHLEVAIDGDALRVGGVLVHGSRGVLRELAPLLPVTIRRRSRVVDVDKGRAPEAVEAAAVDAGHAGGRCRDGGRCNGPGALTCAGEVTTPCSDGGSLCNP